MSVDENKYSVDGISVPHVMRGDVTKWQEPPEDDESDPKNQYDVEKAWDALFNIRTCQKVMLTDKIQKQLELEVGKNVSQEFPWKQIKYKDIRPVLDICPHGNLMARAMSRYDRESTILFGYAPLLTQNQEDVPEGEPFIFFLSPEDGKKALTIIQNIEMYERWLMNKRIIKQPRRWVSLGSEDEVFLTLQQIRTEPMDVEIQSVYPIKIPKKKNFAFRLSSDVRDGYVELLPSELVKFENITRRRVTVGIQSAPEMVTLSQQTDPTFPSNAWSQYLYEIKEGEGLDEESEEEDTKEKGQQLGSLPKDKDKHQVSLTKEKEQQFDSKEPMETIREPPELSDQIKFLLATLEFNQIDMYRNDYALLCNKYIEHFTTPYLEETLCFANISKSFQRYVCGIDWYPYLSGLIVTAYTFTTPATIETVERKVDAVQRAVLQPNPILMWSFGDNLNYKLEFQSPQEVTWLSFCYFDTDLLFGGCKNGQLIIWDLQGRAVKLDVEEVQTTAQIRYRSVMADFLKWSIQINEDSIVPPATITSLESSQDSAITGIYWMGERFYINPSGKLYTDPNKKNKHRFFVTCAIDGTITFWDLNAEGQKTQSGASSRRDQPKALVQSESAYKNKAIKPVFQIAFHEPITSIVMDTSVFRCMVVEPAKKRKNTLNYRTDLIPKDPKEMRQSVITSSFYGRIERLQWLGVYAEVFGRESITSSIPFARVHDGPVIAMKKNPFYPSLFVSIGRNVFAVWKEDYNYSPIFWRKCSTDLTAVAWSEDRPCVLFITRIDGNLEAWDILARDDAACFNDILGGGIVTAISEHRPNDPEKLLGIGDYNSSFRMVKLPQSFYLYAPNELTAFKAYVRKEKARKQSIQQWEHIYFENYRDIIEAKRQAEIDIRKEMDRIEKESVFNAARKLKEEQDKKEDGHQSTNLSYTERMKRKWDELNLNRLLSILMSRKRVNAEQLEKEIFLEKKHLAYEAAKKESYAQVLARVNEEVAVVRSRILPAERVDLSRIDMILSEVNELMRNVDEYNVIEEESNEIIDGFDSFRTIDYVQFLTRGYHRRAIMIKTLGGNTERQYWYQCNKEDKTLNECDWGYEEFLETDEGDFASGHAIRLIDVPAEPEPDFISGSDFEFTQPDDAVAEDIQDYTEQQQQDAEAQLDGETAAAFEIQAEIDPDAVPPAPEGTEGEATAEGAVVGVPEGEPTVEEADVPEAMAEAVPEGSPDDVPEEFQPEPEPEPEHAPAPES